MGIIWALSMVVLENLVDLRFLVQIFIEAGVRHGFYTTNVNGAEPLLAIWSYDDQKKNQVFSVKQDKSFLTLSLITSGPEIYQSFQIDLNDKASLAKIKEIVETPVYPPMQE